MKNIFFFIGIIFLGCKDNKGKDTETISNKALSIPTYNFEELEKQLPKEENKTYVVNFWATWCAPCVEELPYFTELDKKNENIEVILVSLDMPKMKESQLVPFIKKKKIKSKVILLDDPYSNLWIPKVNKDWDGAIPATLIYNTNNRKFYPNKFDSYQELFNEIQILQNES